MAVLHKKEEKIQAVLGRLPQKYTDEEFVAMFIKLYSKDWGKIKSAYIKQSQDKEPGTVINMPKPDLYLKQVLETYLKNNVPVAEIKAEVIAEPKKVKAPTKKKALVEELTIEPKKAKAPAKEKAVKKVVVEELVTEPKKAKEKAVKEALVVKPKKVTAPKKVKEEKK